MSQADCLTALLDYYGLKKEGKVAAGAGGEPCLAGAKVISVITFWKRYNSIHFIDRLLYCASRRFL